MKIEKVEADRIDDIWLDVRDLLEKPLERGLGEYSLDDLRYWLTDNFQQLWTGTKDQEIVLAFTTQIDVYPKQKHLQIVLVGAKDHTINNWIDHFSEPVERFCKENNIHLIEAHGREGWGKVLKVKGYRKHSTILVKEIKYANI